MRLSYDHRLDFDFDPNPSSVAQILIQLEDFCDVGNFLDVMRTL